MSQAARSRAAHWAFVAASLAALACALALALFPSRSDDVFLYLAVGRRFFTAGRFPEGDPFLSISLKSDWLAHWLTHLLTYGVYLAGGWSALVLGKTAVVLAGAAATPWVSWRLGRPTFIAPAALLLGLWAGCERFIERSSLFSDALGAWALALLSLELVRPSRWRWALPAVFLLWNNLHPGALAGMGLVGAAALARPREWRRWLPVTAACFAALLVHPSGPANLWRTAQSMLGPGSDVIRRSYWEFMPTYSPFYSGSLQVRLFSALLVATPIVLAATWKANPLRWFALLILAQLTWLGVSSFRFVTTASLSLPVLIAALASAPRALGSPPAAARPGWRRWPLLSTATAAVALALAIKTAVWGYTTVSGPRRFGLGLDQRAVPARAADFVKRQSLAGRIFNEHGFGAYLAWRWDGDPPVLYHGHVMITDPTFYAEDYLGATRSPEDFDRVVARYDIGTFFMQMQAVTPTSGPLLHRLLVTRPEWHLVYWDQVAMVFVRDLPAHRALIERYGYRYLNPFREDLVQRGLREAPDRLLEEAGRALRDSPDNQPLRSFVRRTLGRDPDSLLAGR